MLLRTDVLQKQSLGAPEGRKDVKQEDLAFILTRKNTKKKKSPDLQKCVMFLTHIRAFPAAS